MTMNKILYPEQTSYISSFRKEIDPLLKNMEAYASKNNVPILSWQSADFIEQLILLNKPKKVLEIGTAIGYTTIRIARNLKKDSKIHTIEISKDNIPIAKENIKKSGVSKKIKLIEGDALQIIPTLKRKYDLIFLDADKIDYINLFSFSMKILKKKGLIIVDNVLWQGFSASEKVPEKYMASTEHIRKFNEIFMNLPDLISTIIPIGDGLGLGIKK